MSKQQRTSLLDATRRRSCARASTAKRPTRALAAIIMLVLALTLTACGDNSSDGGTGTGAAKDAGNPPASPTGTLRVALPGQPESLDPTKAIQNMDLPIMTALYDSLVARESTGDNELIPALATSWKSNADATEWTLKLREGVDFTDGVPFDSAAVKKSFEWAGREGSIFTFAVGDVVKIATPDSSTVVFTYEKPFPDFARNLPFVKMISPKLLSGPTKEAEDRVATTAVGTGPYILDSFSSTSGVVAHANPDYWGDGPHIEKLELRPIPEESAQNAALQSGDIDLVQGISPRTAQTLASDPNLTVTTVPSWNTVTLSLATDKESLKDVRVRQALNYAFDREAVAKGVMLDQATVTGSLVPPGTYGYRKPATQYTYDPAKAKALLKEAGVSEPVHLTMAWFTSAPLLGPIGQALAEQAKEAGFDIKVVSIAPGPGGIDLDEPQRENDIYMLVNGWITGAPFHLAIGFVSLHSQYKGEKFDDLIAQMNATADGPEREQIIGDLVEEEATVLPEIPVFVMNFSNASTNRLKNYIPNKSGYFLPNWAEAYLADAE